jgi:MarR family 2-MHQ and catechol resistance regulon transcriptional repressor
MNKSEATLRCDPLHLLHSLMQGGRALEARIDARLAEVGLSSARWNALRALAESDGMPLGQLAEHLSCVRSKVTQLVDRREAEDLVQRMPDPGVRRSVWAELTAKGRAQYDAGLRLKQSFERQLLSEFAPEERELLARLLSRLGSEEPART